MSKSEAVLFLKSDNKNYDNNNLNQFKPRKAIP